MIINKQGYYATLTQEDSDIMYRKGTSHRDLYHVQDIKDARIMALFTKAPWDGGRWAFAVKAGVQS